MARFRVQGITDDCTTCECCGRVNLKRTVLLVELDIDGNDLDAVYYGTGCAALATGTTTTRIRNTATVGDGLTNKALTWARSALPMFSAMDLFDYMAANPYVANRPAEADRRLTATIAEARKIIDTAGRDLVGTRFERELRELPTVVLDKPARGAVSAVSVAQGALW
ncbi:hypothetical protein [Micromonospora sp. RP3T]|uniref:hypothetical protein n=1 Tax=Micromonospora sp. RP3T TaxID=2135446 RepID=UPI003D717058